MTAATAISHNYADSFSKLSKLREDVLSGAHPRIKLPQAAIKRLQDLDGSLTGENVIVPKAPSIVVPVQGNGPSDRVASDQADQPEPTNQLNGLSVPTPRSNPLAASDSNTQLAPQFLPFLLEKSPALVQAEERSKRQREEHESQKSSKESKSKRTRLEKLLRSEFEKHGGDEKPRNELRNWDGPLVIDAEKLHEEAIPIANTSSSSSGAIFADAAASPHSSFDENSYYSSQVNERWSTTSEEGEVTSESGAHQSAKANSIANGRQQLNQAARNPPVNTAKPPYHSSTVADAPARPGNHYSRGRGGHPGRDESYSPPSPGAFRKDVPGRRPPEGVPRGPRATQRVLNKTQSQQHHQDSEEYSPPSAVVPIVRNHINAPVAPQPSRISPLTSRYEPRQMSDWNGSGINDYVDHSRNYGRKNDKRQQHNGRVTGKQPVPNAEPRSRRVVDKSRQQYSDDIPKGTISRKRGRDENVEDNQYGQQHAAPPAKRRELPPRTVQSPLPYIKPEPISPPPMSALSNVQDAREDAPLRLVRRDDGYVDHERSSHPTSSFSRPLPARRPTYDELDRQYVSRDMLHPAGARVPSSPATLRRPDPSTQDLRRVASLQSASEHQVRPAADPYRPADFDHLDPSSRRHLYEDGVEYIPVTRHSAPVRYASPAPHVNNYTAGAYNSPRMMMPPPPKKRIIVLENGEEWLAVPNTATSRHSLAPEPAAYQSPYAGRPLTVQRTRPLMYEQPRREIIELDDEDEGFQQMPPPPPPPLYRPRPVHGEIPQDRAYSNQQLRSRATSIQPYPPRPREQMEPVPVARGYLGQDPGYAPQRAISAVPSAAQQLHSASFQRRPAYDLR